MGMLYRSICSHTWQIAARKTAIQSENIAKVIPSQKKKIADVVAIEVTVHLVIGTKWWESNGILV